MSKAFVILFWAFLASHCLIAEGQQESFTRTISTADDKVIVDFKLFPIRTFNFGVLVQKDDGSLNRYTPSVPQTYFGIVQGYPGAMAAGLLKANGVLLSMVSFENGIEWDSKGGVASVRKAAWKPQWPTSVVPSTAGDSVIYVAEVGLDAAYEEYVATGSNVQDTIDMLEFSVMCVNVPFVRDASILHKIGKVVIRATQSQDPYRTSSDTGFLLNTVKSQWESGISSMVGKTHNLALVAKPGANGGLAWVRNIGTSLAYSSNNGDSSGDFSNYWRHEAGHNWGSGHYEGGGRPEGPTIMSDNTLSRFSSPELAKILNYKAEFPQLANGTVSIVRPPRANMDTFTIPYKRSVVLDVLANDLDASIQGLNIISVKNPSALDSTVKISSNKQVSYTPSPAAGLSMDYFSYTIQNANGRTSTNYALLRPEDLVAWWKMEETSGESLQDSSGNEAHGTTGSTTWDQGNGLIFQGAANVSLGTKPSLSGTTSFTISVWVKVPAGSTSGVIIQQRSPPSSSTDGFNGEYQLFLTNGKPRLMVFGDGEYQFDFSASASVNDGQWHHVVAIRDYRDGRIYIDGTLSGSAIGDVKNLDKSIAVFMGCDVRDKVAFLTGTLMGVRIYSRSLSLEEVQYLSTRPEALVGWWKMDEGSGATLKDSSGNFVDGAITGSTVWSQVGLIFDGSGKVSLGTKPSLSGKISFSVHAWVKVATSFTSKGIIIQQRSPGFNGEYQLYLSNGKPGFMVFGDGNYQFDFTSSASVNDGQWHHVVATRDKKEGRIYIDGKLSGSATGEARSLDGNIAVFMGWDALDANGFLKGSLRGIKVYNQVVNLDVQTKLASA